MSPEVSTSWNDITPAGGVPTDATLQLLTPEEIVARVDVSEPSIVTVAGLSLHVLPHVYPSHLFRGTAVLLRHIHSLVKGQRVMDMGCGYGLVGFYALQHRAVKAIMIDANPHAILNSERNRERLGHAEQIAEIVLSDCFERVPLQTVDLIVLNPPFDPRICASTSSNPLMNAFFDSNFQFLQSFLAGARRYCHSSSKIVVAYSDKGPMRTVEQLFDTWGYQWVLWQREHANHVHDSRLYLLKP